MYDEEGGGVPQNPYGMERGLLQYQVDNKEIISEIRKSVLELVPVEEGDTIKWVQQPGVKPKINERGLNSVIGKLRSRMNKAFILSNLDKELIQKMSESMSEEVIDDLYANWPIYEIRSTAAASEIASLIVDSYIATLMKAKDAAYLKFLRTSQIVQESNVVKEDTSQQPPPSPFAEARSSWVNLFQQKKR